MQLWHHWGLQCFSWRVVLCPLEAWNRVSCLCQLKERVVDLIFPHYQKKSKTLKRGILCCAGWGVAFLFFPLVFCLLFFGFFSTWTLLEHELLKPVLVFNYTSTNKNFANICFCLCLYTLWSNSLTKNSVEEFATQAETSFTKFYGDLIL